MKKLGWGIFRRMRGPVTQDEWLDVLHAGGYDTPEFRQAWQGKQMRNMIGRGIPTFVPPPEFPGGDHGYTPKTLPMEGPMPGRRDTAIRENLAILNDGMRGRGLPSGPGGIDQFRAQDFTVQIGVASEEAGSTFGKMATQNLEGDAEKAGSAFGRAAAAALQGIIGALQNPFGPPKGNTGVNANVGKSAGAATPPTPPAGSGW